MTLHSPPATRARFFTAFWLCSMAAVLYLDRICWGKAVPSIQKEFELSNTQMAYLAMAFQLAYGVFEVPTGRWGEIFGARAILTRITIWWSIFTALTGACLGFWSLLFVRFLFGAGEAGAYPNAARVLTRWFPSSERGRVQGIMLAVSLFGGAASPTLAALLIDRVGWRWSFAVFGSIGIVWALGYRYWFRDDPAQHKAVNAAELAIIHGGGGVQSPTHSPVPWRQVIRNPGIQILSMIIICSSFNSYFYFTWFPKYLESAHGVENQKSGLLTTLALTGSAFGVLGGGVIADHMRRSARSPIRSRRIFCCSAFSLAAIFLYFAVQSNSVEMLASLAALSCLSVQLTLPTWWSAAIEQSGRHVGPLFGLMNMMGTIGALASQGFVGVFADWQERQGLSGRAQWDPMFQVYILALTLGAIGWAVYRQKPIEPDEIATSN